MGRLLSFDNIDSETLEEGNRIQREQGVRWVARDWAAFRTSKLLEREIPQREQKLQAELQPVIMHSKLETKWARGLSGIEDRDNQKTRTAQRIYDASEEKKRFEVEQRKWDKQTAEVLEGSRWGS